MDELSQEQEEYVWEAGFESGRCLVVSRFGPILRSFPRPQRFRKRFWQHIHPLPIHDWHLPTEGLQLGDFCEISAQVHIRFQSTIQYARDHLDLLSELNVHIQSAHEPLLKDLVEENLYAMGNDPGWLESGHGRIERDIERAINERLAINNIQSRTRCRIATNFKELDETDEHGQFPWCRHQAIYQALLQRQREIQAQRQQIDTDRLEQERRRALEEEEQLLTARLREDILRQARLAEEAERVRAELAHDERLQAEQRDSEARMREEQIRHTARIRDLELTTELEEKARRAQTMEDMEEHLKREIELLALERQRLLLEDEVREVKMSKARGWVINAKKRFSFGENRKVLNAEDSPVQTAPGDESSTE